MMTKTLPASTGSAGRALKYISERTKDRENDPVHLFGDGAQVVAITEAMTCKHTYLSSVLSFTPEDSKKLSIDEIRELALDLARHHAGPVGEENIASVAYLHHEHGRYDVHLLQARQDLETGKRVDLYVAPAGDVGRLADWQDIKNFELGLDDPRDPERQRLTKTPRFEDMTRKELRKAIDEEIESAALAGQINNRAEVKEYIGSLGLNVTRETPKAISIEVPKSDKPMRLSGGIYDESWSGISDLERAANTGRGRDEYARREHYEQCRTRLAENNQRRAIRLSKKAGVDFEGRRAASQGVDEAHSAHDLHSIAAQLRTGRGDGVVGNQHDQRIEQPSSVHNAQGWANDLRDHPAAGGIEGGPRPEPIHQNQQEVTGNERTNIRTNIGIDHRIQQATTDHAGIARRLAEACRRAVDSARNFVRSMGRKFRDSEGRERSFGEGFEHVQHAAERAGKQLDGADRLVKSAAALSHGRTPQEAVEAAKQRQQQTISRPAPRPSWARDNGMSLELTR